MNLVHILLIFCSGYTLPIFSEQPQQEHSSASITSNLETTDVAELPDSAINLPSSIELSIKFPATKKKPEAHSVDLILSKSTLATLNNYGTQAITWAFEQARNIVHKAAVFTADATKRND